jgi:hypothetical protein
MTSVTTLGCDTMITCDPAASVAIAPARRAIRWTTSLPAALSPVATTAQDGRVFQAGAPDGSANPSAERGRWVAAMTRARSSETSAAKASWNLSRLIVSLDLRLAVLADGVPQRSSAVFSTLSVDPASMSCSVSPSSGAKAAT